MADEPITKPDDKPAGDKPPEPKPEVSFKTKAEFHAEIERKTKSAVRAAVDEANKALLEKLGVESEDDLPAIVEGVKKSKQAVSDSDKLKGDYAKLEKKHNAAVEQVASLSQWRESAIKGRAISAYQSKTVDLETLTLLVGSKIVIRDDDSVSGPDGKALDDVVEEILKAKPFLKAADHVGGAGTKPGGGKPDGDAKPKPNLGTGDVKPNGRPPSIGQTVADALRASAAANGGGGTGL